jgi:gamma-glutamylcysteine synthetase
MSTQWNPLTGVEFERNLSLSNGDYVGEANTIESIWRKLAEINTENSQLKIDLSSKKPTGIRFTNSEDKILELVNDTGYGEFEFASPPYSNLTEGKIDTEKIFQNIKTAAKTIDDRITCLGVGIHPFLEANTANYMKYRSPKGFLYVLLNEGTKNIPGRKWSHYEYLNATSDQTNIDLPKGYESEAILSLNRVMGVLIALSANSPFENGKLTGHKSSRQTKAQKMIANAAFKEDTLLADMPQTEPNGMNWFYDILFTKRRMICAGKDKGDRLLVPLDENGEIPTLLEYLKSDNEWPAWDTADQKKMLKSTGEDIMSPVHRICLWNTKPQLNFASCDPMNKTEIIEAMNTHTLHELFNRKNVQSYIEVRAIDASLPHEELAMPALIKGLMLNHEILKKITDRWDYASWLKIAKMAGEKGMDWSHKGVQAQNLCMEILEIAKDGLNKVNEGAETQLLKPIEARVHKNECPADILIKNYEQKSWEGVLKKISY